MKPIVLLTMLFVAFGSVSLQAEDWTTLDGKVYASVTVVKVEADAVTILYKDGGAMIPLTNLPVDLQKKFNFDPDKAKAAADARAQADADNAKALQAEADQAAKLKAAKLIKAEADRQAAAAAQTKAAPSSSLGTNANIADPNRFIGPVDTSPEAVNKAAHPGIDSFNPDNFQNGDILGKPIEKK